MNINAISPTVKSWMNKNSICVYVLGYTQVVWRFKVSSSRVIHWTQYHDDVMNWKHFPRYWPFVRGIHRSPMNSPQRPVTRNFDVFFDLRLNKRLSKQWWGWWFKTLSRPLWRHRNVEEIIKIEENTRTFHYSFHNYIYQNIGSSFQYINCYLFWYCSI